MKSCCSLLALSVISFTLAIPASAQEGSIPGQKIIGSMGVTKTIKEILANPAPESLLHRFGRLAKRTEKEGPDRKSLPQDANAIQGAGYAQGVGPIASLPGNLGGRHGNTPFLPQTLGTQFNGGGGNSVFPPDTIGSVGPNHIMVATNNIITAFTKAGAVVWSTSFNTFFNSVRNGSGMSDPVVRYDRTSQRWFVIGINVASPNRITLAVSNNDQLTTSSAFTFFFYQVPSAFCDYPSLGVDRNALYIGENTFNTALTAFLGCAGNVVQKSSMLSGGPIVVNRFQLLSGSNGPFAPRGVTNDDPASTDGYFIGVDNAVFSRLVVRKIQNPGSASPTLNATLFNITVPVTTNPADVPNLGSTSPLDSLDDRLFAAEMRLNRISNSRSIWTAHNIRINSSGTGSVSGDRDGARWYEVGNLGGTPTLTQSGTAFDSAASTPLYSWMPSCIMSGQGHMAIGFNMANSANRVSLRAAGRLRTDALGTTQAATLVIGSGANYNAGLQNGAYRWGDYSITCVDPNDDQTIWTIGEYVSGTNNWMTRVAQLIAPPPSVINTVSPNTLGQGVNSNVVINGASVSGSEYYDTDATYPNRLAVSVSGGDVTVNSVTWNSISQITINVSVSGSATPGARDITIVNPDGQQVVGVGVLTITGGGQATYVPTAVVANLGQITAGSVTSLATAGDNDELEVRKFVVPNATSPYVRLTITAANTGLTNISAASIELRDRSVSSGLFRRTLNAKLNGGTGATRDSLATQPFTTGFATFTLPLTGPLNDYLGTNGTLGCQIEVLQVGPSASALPLSRFDRCVWIVTP